MYSGVVTCDLAPAR